MKTYEELLAERDALAAQVAQLEKTVIAIRARGNILHGLTIQLMHSSELCGSDWDYISEAQVLEIQQCLAEIKAEAGRAGFIACAEWVGDSEYENDKMQDAANEYAAKIRNTGTWLKDSNVNSGERQGGEK